MRTGFKPYCKNNRPDRISLYGKCGAVITESTGDRYPIDVIEFKADNNVSSLHPTQKPVALLEYLIKTYTNEGEIVLDNCMGSGSTCVAAINTNRHYIGYEKEQKYFDIADERIKQALTSVNKR